MSRSPINVGSNSPNRQPAPPVELTPVHQLASRRLRGDSKTPACQLVKTPTRFGHLFFTPRETRTTDAATMTSQTSRDGDRPTTATHNGRNGIDTQRNCIGIDCSKRSNACAWVRKVALARSKS
ncbi:hypothetical protein HPB50_014777 [Hyalomma asiaticum]|uniref:Uncharacterized protein n=1 Tax=Hyalomma asiaticum TaxID=266040 RepID=A0ACB7RJA8_HYAAI|nr:hypothetical protein HPB50_014777 [Hyalomma asiaticum]